MKIAFFTDTYLPNRDGVVTALANYRQELERIGHEVFIFTPGTKKQKKENRDRKVHYFTSASFKPYPDYRLSLFPFLSAVKAAREIKPDMIHSHGVATTGLAAVQCSRNLKVPAIASFHTMIPQATHYLAKGEDTQKLLEKVAWKYLRWYYSLFRVVTVPSEYTAKVLRQHGIENTRVLPMGIDIKFYGKGDGKKVRDKHSLNRKKIVLHVGRMVEEKNIGLIINEAQSIINKNPNIRFVMVGSGPSEESFRSMARMKGVEEYFIFTGFVPRGELPDYYAAADVFAFPSTFDTQGLVALEAMAAGTPVVVQADSAAADLVEDGVNGFTFESPIDFREKVLAAVESGEKMARAAREKASEYSKRKRTEDLVRLYETILSSP